ncbi:MMPL family transporter [Nocardioides sp. W3-2-3]|uniref:MMPL family transporter n=1 Tax=Nocardioides convexus TaxID=2712224 RepID=UPI0024186C1E|nr:MMPL family transporter [Nocardioides convexus]NHA01327.1 MMPL family transporter [Nocardioides convexus]
MFPQTFLKSIGYGGIAAVLIAMVAALTVLPAALALLGTRIDALRIPFLQRAPRTEDDHGGWARLARAVMRRPVLVAVGVVAVLLVVASPFLGVKWGSVDYRVLPADTPSHQASERLNTEFGAERSTANVLVEGADRAGLDAYVAALSAVPGVVDVRPVATDGDTTLLRAAWRGNSQSEASQQVVRDLRTVDAPAGADALVGGLTASTVDLATSVGDHLPLMGLIVVGVMLVLLFLAFGSLVLPLKAVLMNAFSITASFGVVTWIFSDGHLAGLLGFTPQGFLDMTNPIVMLAVLFGLSMDYEVFLLSRVREQWDATGSNDLAVQAGVQKTGRIITSAALLLAVVIGAFSLSGVVFMKMMGIGMLVAILVDATVVRALLVPATMKPARPVELVGSGAARAVVGAARLPRGAGGISDSPHGSGSRGHTGPVIKVGAIDDHPVVLAGVGAALAQSAPDLRLVAIADTVDALLAKAPDGLDVVLLDLHMPGQPHPEETVGRLSKARDRGAAVHRRGEARPGTTRDRRRRRRAGPQGRPGRADRAVDPRRRRRRARLLGPGSPPLCSPTPPWAPGSRSGRSRSCRRSAPACRTGSSRARLGISEVTVREHLSRAARAYRDGGVDIGNVHGLISRARADGHLDE